MRIFTVMIALVSWENDPVYIFHSSCKYHVKEQSGLRWLGIGPRASLQVGVWSALPANRPQRFRCSLAKSCEPWGSPLHKGAHQPPRLGALTQIGTHWCLLPFICLTLQGPQLPSRAPEGWRGAAPRSFAVLVLLSLPPAHIPLELPCLFGTLFFNLLRFKPPISPLQSLSLKPPRYPAAALSPCVVWGYKFPQWSVLVLYASCCWPLLSWFVSICGAELESLSSCLYNVDCFSINLHGQ